MAKPVGPAAREQPARDYSDGQFAPTTTIKRRLLTDQVADSIRHMILVGELHPSVRFTQQELAERIGVSTMPIREALLRLSHEGLITATPNRSYAVTPMTRHDIRDIYWMHSTIAGELTERACRLVDAAFVTELRRLNQRNLEALKGGRVDEMEAANWEFHRAINHAANAPRLLHLIRGTVSLIPEHFYTLLPKWAGMSKRGHERILKAFETHDPDAARVAASTHVLDASILIIDHFSDTGYWTIPTPTASTQGPGNRR